MDYFYNLSSKELQKIIYRRRKIINKELGYYIIHKYFKNYNIIHYGCKYDEKTNCDKSRFNDELFYIELLIDDFKIKIYYIHKYSKYTPKISCVIDNVSSGFHGFIFFHDNFEERNFQCLSSCDEAIKLIESLYSDKNYDKLTDYLDDKFYQIYKSDYLTRLQNIMLILCQAKFHRTEFPLPYDVVKIIAYKLMI